MPDVLIVDDEADMRLLVHSVIDIDNGGLRVIAEAATGAEAIIQWRCTRPDVVLLDHRLPDMTGLDAAETILGEDPTQSIVLFSAFLDGAAVSRAAEIGVRACVAKGDLSHIPDTLRLHAA